MAKGNKPQTYKFPIKFKSANFGKKAVGLGCEIDKKAIGTLTQTLEFMTRAQLKVTVFDKDQTEKLNAKDKMMKIVGIANTAKVSYDIDHLGLTLSFDLNSVNNDAVIFFSNDTAMIEVEHMGEAGNVPHADDDNQSTFGDNE